MPLVLVLSLHVSHFCVLQEVRLSMCVGILGSENKIRGYTKKRWLKAAFFLRFWRKNWKSVFSPLKIIGKVYFLCVKFIGKV